MNNDNRDVDPNRDPLIDPARQRACWSENFSGRDCIEKGSGFDDYGPAYDGRQMRPQPTSSMSLFTGRGIACTHHLP